MQKDFYVTFVTYIDLSFMQEHFIERLHYPSKSDNYSQNNMNTGC